LQQAKLNACKDGASLMAGSNADRQSGVTGSALPPLSSKRGLSESANPHKRALQKAQFKHLRGNMDESIAVTVPKHTFD